MILMRGLSVIDRLFPAFIGELAEAGALIFYPADDFLWINPAGLACDSIGISLIGMQP